MSQYNDFGGGGGFLQGGSPYSTGGSPSTRMREAAHSLRPLTVCQLKKAKQAHTDAEWTIEGREIGQVTVVGQVVSVQSQTTNRVYWIDDSTGRIEARHWVDSTSEEDATKWDGIQDSSYVRVTGTLKMFGNKRYINATHIRAVIDPHEPYFHLLEAMTVKLMVDRGASMGPKHGGVIDSGGASAYTSNQSSVTPDQYSDLPALEKQIVKFLSEQQRSVDGIHVSAIARAVSSFGDVGQISDALDRLMDNGTIYSTIDDSHFNVIS